MNHPTRPALVLDPVEAAQHGQAILDNVLEAIITTDSQGLMTSFNRAATRIFGYDAQEVIGRNVSLLMPAPDRAQHGGYMARYESTREARVIGVGRETFGQHKCGLVFPIQLSLSAIERDGQLSYVGLVRDISEQKEAESHIERLAYYDALTGLPNRRLLLDQLAQLHSRFAKQGGHAALIFADIDRFKSVNDTLGHAGGDALLRATGERLKECLVSQGLVARMGGDEFAMLIPDLDADADMAQLEAAQWCQRLLHRLRCEHQLAGHEYRTSASLGVLLIRDGREAPEALLAHAELAMQQAKSESRDTYRFYDAEMGRSAALRAGRLNDLRLSLRRQELALVFQPQVDEWGDVLGAEALLRWRHPSRGTVSPADFIPLAEQSGFIIQIGQWVLLQACDMLAAWRRHRHTAVLSIAINISATEFRDPEFVATVSRALAVSGADPRRLKLELTESVLTVDLSDLAQKLSAIKRMGVSLSLDDFGTGYSSMAYLRELPLDQLKIDRSFIVEIDRSARDEVLVRGMVEMCRVLGLSVIAEGVETPSQRERLLACGCTSFQGYLTGRPMSAEDLDRLIGTDNAALV
ncbi:putative bifunctional diguanylate cyclase/phosphodiesterase [Paucibacter sp. XJ19-41]|uniref:putative bifunctional diguanylate cyclase/phosphodiesterase n=1 Tax=Paucibacter sp. XJ19-41 TaxID=2927824 RepID=UPI00234BDB2A|nr:EAL domain-containing protein [Paucibacter sp. XJ19-41]MDC6166620.1 EAL domain-containing protein [Paucibacter sp. XJ19-41]